MARLGYAVSTILENLVSVGIIISWLTDEGRRARRERVLERTMGQLAGHWAGLGPYLMGLEEESRRLMEEL